jgi:ABC-type amino acid transport substrate-binding protein
MKHKIKSLTILMATSFVTLAYAQSNPTAQVTNKATSNPAPQEKIYEGKTLDKVKSTGKIFVGVRTSSIPLSYTATGKEDSKAMGYAVDICNIIVDKYKQKYNLPNIVTEYVFVTAKTRIPKVRAGEVDLECGSTTNNADRRKSVDFSIPYYVAGAKALVKSSSGVENFSDLKNKKVAYLKGTTMAGLLDNYNQFRKMGIVKKEYANIDEAFNGLEKNEVDAFVYDDLILYGLRANSANPLNYNVAGEYLSVEPEGIMMRKGDSEFINFVNKELVNIIKNGQIDSLYSKWFLNPIPPKNANLSIQQSFLLKDVFRDPTTIVGD